MSAKTGPLADDARANAAARVNANAIRQIEADLKAVIDFPQGRRFLANLIFDSCKVMVTEEKPTNADIYRLAGRREIGESLLGTLEAIAPAETRSMVDEWFKLRFERRAEIERAAGRPTGDDR